MKYIVFSGPGGIASVHIPAYKDKVYGQLVGETEDQFIARVVARCVQTGSLPATGYIIVDSDPRPARYYRNAWRFDGTKIIHDMAVARQLKLNEEIRPERNKRLQALDVEWSRAVAQGNAALADQVEQKRRVLRDTPAIVAIDLESCPTVVQIKNYTPSWP